MNSKLVRDGYNRITKEYLAHRAKLKSEKYVTKLLKYLPKQSTILDLGCGAGVPVDIQLVKAGGNVWGLDIAEEQIKLARKLVPGAGYEVRDIMTLKKGEFRVDAVVAMYVWFHLPRRQQGELLTVVESFLPRGGMLLITMGDTPFEGEHELQGVKMWSSQYGTARNRQLVEDAGFTIVGEEMDTSGGERHQVILAQK